MKIILIIGTLAIISFLVSLIITKGKSEVKTKREIENKLINDELEDQE